jgi:hypothetical protein
VLVDTVEVFPITIAGPTTGMTAIDVTLTVYPPAEDDGLPQ